MHTRISIRSAWVDLICGLSWLVFLARKLIPAVGTPCLSLSRGSCARLPWNMFAATNNKPKWLQSFAVELKSLHSEGSRRRSMPFRACMLANKTNLVNYKLIPGRGPFYELNQSNWSEGTASWLVQSPDLLGSIVHPPCFRMNVKQQQKCFQGSVISRGSFCYCCWSTGVDLGLVIAEEGIGVGFGAEGLG